MENSLKTIIYRLVRAVKSHVGSGGNAHLPANARRSGFASVETFKDASNLGRALPSEYTSTIPGDVLSLPNGYYVTESTKLTGIPSEASGVIYLDVRGAQDYGQRQFTLFHSATGKRWQLDLHTDKTQAQIPVGWRRLFAESMLYKYTGSTPQAQGTVLTFAETLGNFERLRIVYFFEGDLREKTVTNSGNIVINESNLYNDGVTADILVGELYLQRFKMTELTVALNSSTRIKATTNELQTNKFIVREIWGIR